MRTAGVFLIALALVSLISDGVPEATAPLEPIPAGPAARALDRPDSLQMAVAPLRRAAPEVVSR